MQSTLKSKEEIKELLAAQSSESIKELIEASKKHASEVNRLICYANRELKRRKKNREV